MFENALLIIKPDYLHKRKAVLLHLLAHGFQMQGSRRVQFSPEDAAEFYNNMQGEQNFMLQVILLSKGVSEAFVLTKQNAVEDLFNIMCCYFCTSTELENNIHVSRNKPDARREINFIFPNSFYEPFEPCNVYKFGSIEFVPTLMEELYNLTQSAEGTERWKSRISDWLMLTNSEVPRITNQCSSKPTIGFEDKAQQTIVTKPHKYADSGVATPPVSASSSSLSRKQTSSSCISCSGFASGDVCFGTPKSQTCIDILKAKAMRLASPSTSEEVCPPFKCLESTADGVCPPFVCLEGPYKPPEEMAEEEDYIPEEEFEEEELEAEFAGEEPTAAEIVTVGEPKTADDTEKPASEQTGAAEGATEEHNTETEVHAEAPVSEAVPAAAVLESPATETAAADEPAEPVAEEGPAAAPEEAPAEEPAAVEESAAVDEPTAE